MFVKALDFMGAYNSLLKALHEQGVEAQPRGRVVQEFRHPVMWTISNHTNWVPGIKGRRLNIFFALAEVVWMWSGNGSVDYIAFYNESIRQFQDGDLRYFNAAYGKRVRHSGYKEDPLVRPEMPGSPGMFKALMALMASMQVKRSWKWTRSRLSSRSCLTILKPVRLSFLCGTQSRTT